MTHKTALIAIVFRQLLRAAVQRKSRLSDRSELCLAFYMAILDEIRFVLKAKADAIITRNTASLDALIHSDFVYVNAGGRAFDKSGYIETFCTSGRVAFQQQRIAGLLVKEIDHFAVATFSVEDEFTIEGRAVSGHYSSLCVFTQPSRHWLWVAGQTMVATSA